MRLFVFSLMLGAGLIVQAPVNVKEIKPVLVTEAVTDDADDPSLWIHPTDPSKSLIIGTNKVAAPKGALVVFGMDGKIRQTIVGLDRPNNVDALKGFKLGGKSVDLVVCTERLKHRLRAYQVDAAKRLLVEVPGNLSVFEGQAGEMQEPMGIGLYRRPKDGAMFAIVGRKNGPKAGYLWQYRLVDNGKGGIDLKKVREFGAFSGKKEIESVAVDGPLGYVYYADEGGGIHKWHADPDHPDASRELAHFGTIGFSGDREGIGIYANRDGSGYIVCTDQKPNRSDYHLFKREGEPGKPHEHNEVRVVRGESDETDGIEVSSASLGAAFAKGILIAMNSQGKNFHFYRWEDVVGR